MKKATKKILLILGVPSHLLGYRYLGDAIETTIEDRTKLQGITKILYPEVAKRNGTTWTRVERAIRHAIEHSFNNLTPGVIAEIYGNSLDAMRGKPTNSQFIATIAELYGDEIRESEEI